MARNKRSMQFRGSLDGLVFYQLNGVPVVRKKSGFDKNSFKTKDNYARVRENSSEFGHCSKVGKMLRHAVRPFSEKSGNQFLYQSFAKLMTHIKDLDSYSDRGQRSVAQGLKTEAGKKLLANFVFGKVNSVKGFIKTMSIDDKINVVLDQNTEAEKIHLISVLPNYSKYSFERKEEIKIVNGENRFSFEKHFEEEDVVYFLALSRGKEIVAMGFCDDY